MKVLRRSGGGLIGSGALPVLRDGSVVGIVSERDVIYRLADHGGACLDMPVEQIMTSPAITVEPGTHIDDALAALARAVAAVRVAHEYARPAREDVLQHQVAAGNDDVAGVGRQHLR